MNSKKLWVVGTSELAKALSGFIDDLKKQGLIKRLNGIERMKRRHNLYDQKEGKDGLQMSSGSDGLSD